MGTLPSYDIIKKTIPPKGEREYDGKVFLMSTDYRSTREERAYCQEHKERIFMQLPNGWTTYVQYYLAEGWTLINQGQEPIRVRFNYTIDYMRRCMNPKYKPVFHNIWVLKACEEFIKLLDSIAPSPLKFETVLSEEQARIGQVQAKDYVPMKLRKGKVQFTEDQVKKFTKQGIKIPGVNEHLFKNPKPAKP
jgi:hypothetical protein